MASVTTHAPDESDSSHTAPGEHDEPAILAGSHIVAAIRNSSTHVESWVHNSALYQWLTAEPDPEVIVIDLRETWTVGPVLRVLDWLIDRLVDAAPDSHAIGVAQRGVTASRAAPLRVVGLVAAVFGLGVASSGLLGSVPMIRLAVGIGLSVGGIIAMQDDRDWATLRETRPVALAIAALEPPAPPETTPGDESAAQQGLSHDSPGVSSQDDDEDTADSQSDR